MKIIGITGTLGAGKGTIVDYLVRKKGYNHFSVRQYLTSKIEEQGLDVNRDNMVVVANSLRAEHSPSYIIEELYKLAKKSKKNAVIESIRTPGEINYLKQQGYFLLLAIDADPKVRFDRIRGRQSSTDNVDFKTFVENEKREFTSDDPNKQNLEKCIEQADVLILNNGTINQLHQQLDAKLNLNDQ